MMVLSREILTLEFWKEKFHHKWFIKFWMGGPGNQKVSVGSIGGWGIVWRALVES